MAIIGVLHLSSIANSPTSNQTPGAAILTHISDTYPTEIPQIFHLDHRLFISTSSLLPNSNTKRTFTHLFTSSHSPQRTFIGTTATATATATSPVAPAETVTGESKNDLSIITVPTASSLEPFTMLLTQKLGPQWAARQSLVLENGNSFSLPIKDNAKWKIGVGDLKLAPARVSGSAAGQFRGVLIEVQYESNGSAVKIDSQNEESKKKYEMLFRELLKGLFRNTKLDLKLDDTKIHLTQLPDEEVIETRTSQPVRLHAMGHEKPPGYQVAELYMEVLRGPRG